MTSDTANSETPALRLLRRAHLHEIRGELNAMKLQVTLLQRGRDGADPERIARWIDGVAEQTRAIERGLEELSAIEHLLEESAEADAGEVVDQVFGLIGPLAKMRRVELIRVDDEAKSPSVSGLARPLLKLAARCLTSLPAGSQCTVGVVSGGVMVRWSGHDEHGPGPEALREGIHSSCWTVEPDEDGVVLRSVSS